MSSGPNCQRNRTISYVDAWVWWVIAAVVLVVAEMLSLTLILAMLAAGAAAAAVAGFLGVNVLGQVLLFAGVSLAGLVVVRPVAKRHLYPAPSIRTGVDALVGSKALVLEQVDAHRGRIKLAGEVWSARTYDGESVIEPGQTVDVVKIDGATALVI
jgi:membrane protein implicated in regulation of membrane protease activity